MKKILTLLFAVLAFVGCDKYDDDNLDRYVDKGAKSIEAQKAIDILSKDRGFWKVNADKSMVVHTNDDGSTQKEPFSLVGYSFGIYQFEESGKVSVYNQTYYPTRAWVIRDVNIDWEQKLLQVGSYEYNLKGVTENYLIIEDALYESDVIIGVYERMLDADITRFLNKTEFVDKRE